MERDPDHVKILVDALFSIWEDALGREDALRLILNDCCPDWKHHYLKYVDDPGSVEHTKIVVAPMRKVAESILRGEENYSLIDEVVAEMKKKPN